MFAFLSCLKKKRQHVFEGEPFSGLIHAVARKQLTEKFSGVSGKFPVIVALFWARGCFHWCRRIKPSWIKGDLPTGIPQNLGGRAVKQEQHNASLAGQELAEDTWFTLGWGAVCPLPSLLFSRKWNIFSTAFTRDCSFPCWGNLVPLLQCWECVQSSSTAVALSLAAGLGEVLSCQKCTLHW